VADVTVDGGPTVGDVGGDAIRGALENKLF